MGNRCDGLTPGVDCTQYFARLDEMHEGDQVRPGVVPRTADDVQPSEQPAQGLAAGHGLGNAVEHGAYLLGGGLAGAGLGMLGSPALAVPLAGLGTAAGEFVYEWKTEGLDHLHWERIASAGVAGALVAWAGLGGVTMGARWLVTGELAEASLGTKLAVGALGGLAGGVVAQPAKSATALVIEQNPELAKAEISDGMGWIISIGGGTILGAAAGPFIGRGFNGKAPVGDTTTVPETGVTPGAGNSAPTTQTGGTTGSPAAGAGKGTPSTAQPGGTSSVQLPEPPLPAGPPAVSSVEASVTPIRVRATTDLDGDHRLDWPDESFAADFVNLKRTPNPSPDIEIAVASRQTEAGWEIDQPRLEKAMEMAGSQMRNDLSRDVQIFLPDANVFFVPKGAPKPPVTPHTPSYRIQVTAQWEASHREKLTLHADEPIPPNKWERLVRTNVPPTEKVPQIDITVNIPGGPGYAPSLNDALDAITRANFDINI